MTKLFWQVLNFKLLLGNKVFEKVEICADIFVDVHEMDLKISWRKVRKIQISIDFMIITF